jgi:hypothetical protein
LSRSTDDIIAGLHAAKAAKEAEQKASRDAIAEEQRQAAETKRAAEDAFATLRSLLEQKVAETNEKLKGTDLEIMLGKDGQAAPSNQLPTFVLRFTPVPQGVKAIVATFIPFIAGNTQVRFKRLNETTILDDRSYTTANFTSQQAEMIINKFLELATS